MTKKELRAWIKQEISLQTDLAGQSDRICSRILASPEYADAELILSYMALPDEVDLSSVNQAALSAGKRLALPRIIPGTNQMEFLLLDAQNSLALETGSLGIREPLSSCEKCSVADIRNAGYVLVLVPGRAFSHDGMRLGRGKGFYDSFLQEIVAPSVSLAGVCFSCQLVQSLPSEPHDIRMHLVFSC